LTLIDVPGLWDTDDDDQKILDDISQKLKKVGTIDIFVLMVSHSNNRFGSKMIQDTITIYQQLCGGRKIWANIVLVITKADFNRMIEDDEEEWVHSLRKIERGAIKQIYDLYGE